MVVADGPCFHSVNYRGADGTVVPIETALDNDISPCAGCISDNLFESDDELLWVLSER
jgi:hypothetical protein